MTESYFGSGVAKPTRTSRPEDSGLVDRIRGGAEAVAAATGTSGAVILDCSLGSVFTLTPTADVTSLEIRNAPRAGKASFLTLIVTQGGTPRAIANPSGAKVLGAAPTQVASKDCVFSYLTVDGGVTWYVAGSVVA